MCEFCTKHGEGKKWYENIANYTEEVFSQVNSERNAKAFLSRLYHSLKTDVERAYTWKRRFPRIYGLIAYPLVAKHLKKTHFGQIVPMEDIENILGNFSSIVRLPCVCRKVTTGENKRYCFGVGMDLTPLFKGIPDFSDFDRLPAAEAKAFIRQLDTEGNTHSVWTFNTPFIGAVCNCNRDCMAYRFQLQMKTGKAMWKGEYVASIDPLKCSGCRECIKRCYFGAVFYDRMNVKCLVNQKNCYGCGICRAVCKNDAIALLERSAVPQVAKDW
ncbi:MAG: 4Fe-4S ferredoxin [Nitrospirae bacterium]|nr:4Fe-4S ferredoxin [Nitrospirota bacterium]MCL5420899.1 4Fe-4S ferredoxin [Nitrospirota bacterium]